MSSCVFAKKCSHHGTTKKTAGGLGGGAAPPPPTFANRTLASLVWKGYSYALKQACLSFHFTSFPFLPSLLPGFLAFLLPCFLACLLPSFLPACLPSSLFRVMCQGFARCILVRACQHTSCMSNGSNTALSFSAARRTLGRFVQKSEGEDVYPWVYKTTSPRMLQSTIAVQELHCLRFTPGRVGGDSKMKLCV